MTGVVGDRQEVKTDLQAKIGVTDNNRSANNISRDALKQDTEPPESKRDGVE